MSNNKSPTSDLSSALTRYKVLCNGVEMIPDGSTVRNVNTKDCELVLEGLDVTGKRTVKSDPQQISFTRLGDDETGKADDPSN